MLDLSRIAANVMRSADGYWLTDASTSVSYPSDGNDVCFGLEDVSFWFRHRNAVIAAAVRAFPPRGGAILDVGGGNGFVTRALQDAGFEAILVEPNRAGCRNALQRGVHNVVCGAVESIGFDRDAIGALALFDVIEHVEDDRAFLSALASHANPGTMLYATVPAFPLLWSSDDVHAGHHRRYRLGHIERVARDCGFDVMYATYFFSLLPLPVFLLRSLPTRLGATQPPSTKELASEHKGRGAIDTLLRFEVRAVQRRRKLPVGSSCLVVARLRA